MPLRSPPTGAAGTLRGRTIGVVGGGRLGTALTHALRAEGVIVVGPFGRGATLPGVDAIVLCVPDRAIADVAATVPEGALVGHCSASVQLDALAPHERFQAHPLLPVAHTTRSFDGAACAVDGSSDRAREFADRFATTLGMRPVHVPAELRALYHAAASMAANYLVTLEWAAERLAARCGISRAELMPSARASLDNWGAQGFRGAITGPVSRGDEGTVRRQRDAVADAVPELLPLFDAMTDATRQAMRDTDPL